MLSGKAKQKIASAATKFRHFRHTEKSEQNFPFKSSLEICLDIWLSKLRITFEKFHLFMGKSSIYQNLKIPFFNDLKFFFSKRPLPKHKID